MAVYDLKQIGEIIQYNPNKNLVEKGRKMNNHLMLHAHGKNLKNCDALKRDDYFENEGAFRSRVRRPLSNKDLISRLLQEEEQVFSARGGSTSYGGLNAVHTKELNNLLSDVRYGYSLRRWVKHFALNAYRSDPMGVIFIEVETQAAAGESTPRAYPTYKSIQDIYDYDTTGRQLEYICFNIPRRQLKLFGIDDPNYQTPGPDVPPQAAAPEGSTGNMQIPGQGTTPYFRFVDDEKDIIVKQTGKTVIQYTGEGSLILHHWPRVPAFIVSDLIQFDNPDLFGSPLQFVIELADDFLYDRSVRNLQKKFHGFAKAVEPLLKCPSCNGEGVLSGAPCPDCTPAGATRGTGYKLQSKVGDIAKFPTEILETIPAFDFTKLFGYVTPPIDSLQYMDLSLDQCERVMYFTYWGVPKDPTVVQGPAKPQGEQTATEVVADLKPKYARLNQTADWAEATENKIATLLGQYYFAGQFKTAQIAYGRSYILETPKDLLSTFYDMRKNGAPQFMLLSQVERYLRALYENAPTELEKYLKLLAVEPMLFVYSYGGPLIAPTPEIANAARFFLEWYQDQNPLHIVSTKAPKLRDELAEYVKTKNIPPPEPPAPAVPPAKPVIKKIS